MSTLFLRPVAIACGLVLLNATTVASAQSSGGGTTTQVTTYITKVQEERQSTRWTLTEWLRIKERMRMMDVWLAMFSNPDKDKFRPELDISYGMTRGQSQLTDSEGNQETASTSGRAARAQLWLTNILTGTVGIRTLNIDFGIEGYKRESGNFEPSVTIAQAQAASANALPGEEGEETAVDDSQSLDRAIATTYYAADLRVFGKNIQDSSLVLKYGQYQSKNNIVYDPDAEKYFKGVMAAAELQLYLFKFLGAEGNYIDYGGSQKLADDSTREGHYFDYLGFVEVSLLRIMVGRYQEDWTLTNGDGEASKTTENGLLAGMKLQF